MPRLSPYFTGRDAKLEQLRRAFTDQAGVARPRVQALSGQGGNGKTQLALEYVRRHRGDYSAVFWVRADSPTECTAGFVGIARQLGLREAKDADHSRAVAAARKWLEEGAGWLLVLDNADQPEEVKAFVPDNDRGHTLLTSRAQAFDMLGVRPISVAPFEPAEAVEFLLNRTDQERAGPTERVAAEELSRELGFLPLALEQAGAYVLTKQARFQDYLATYRNRRLKLLEKTAPVAGDYTNSVATTWRLNFDEVNKSSRAAADLLRVSALLHPDAIPLELLERGAKHLGTAIARVLARLDDEPVVLDELLEPLTKYSLVQRDREARTYSMHPLVQEVLRAAMMRKQAVRWAGRVVRAMTATLPDNNPDSEFDHWPLWERLVPHALCCARHIEEWELSFDDAVTLLYGAGTYLHARGQFALAEPIFRCALAIVDKDLPDQKDFAVLLTSLAELLKDTYRAAEAEPLMRRALDIVERSYGADQPQVASALNNLAQLLHAMDRRGEAEPLLRHSVAIYEKALGPDDMLVATGLNNLAQLLQATDRLGEAEPLMRRALAIDEKALGPDHPHLATALDNLACLLYVTSRPGEAEPLMWRALALREKTLGPDHPLVATSLNNVAQLLKATNRPGEAEPLMRRALAIDEKAFGNDHPRLAGYLTNLVQLLVATDRQAEAEPFMRRLLAMREKALGPDDPELVDPLNDLAICLQVTDRGAEAQPLYERALTIVERALGPDHPNVATILHNLASLLEVTNRPEEAEPLMRRALTIREKAVRPAHPDGP